MAKLTLTSAISAYKKIKANKFLQLTEKEVANFIDDQIKLKRSEIVDLKEESIETSGELKEDFQISLLDLDESNISNRGARKDTAEYYVIEALSKLENIDAFVADKVESINYLKVQIKQLEELRTQLENLDSTIVVEESN